MNILVIGSGGREHALGWKAAQDHSVSEVFVCPGNAGTALENKLSNISINIGDFEAIKDFWLLCFICKIWQNMENFRVILPRVGNKSKTY